MRTRPDKVKVRAKKPCARFVPPLLIEHLEERAQQPFIACLPVLHQIGEVMDGIHQVCQAVTLLGAESATMTFVANQPRVNRCVFQYFETRRLIRFWSKRHATPCCNCDAG